MVKPKTVTLSIESDELFRVLLAITKLRTFTLNNAPKGTYAGEDVTLEGFTQAASGQLVDKMGDEWLIGIGKQFEE